MTSIAKDQSPFYKRPLGLKTLILVAITLAVLTAMLLSMIWNRISLLQNGTQVILKTAPVDPRDLLRGYYVRLNYDISRIVLEDLDEWKPDQLENGFDKNELVYVKLRPQSDGFWSPVSIHRKSPNPESGSVNIRGRTRYNACKTKGKIKHKCTLSLRYGIEKFFAEKKRTLKLEEFSGQVSPEIEKLREEIKEQQKKYSELLKNKGDWRSPEAKKLRDQLQKMRKELSELRTKQAKEMSKRFAVIVRVGKTSGEAAISGLQLDGRRIYEERLF